MLSQAHPPSFVSYAFVARKPGPPMGREAFPKRARATFEQRAFSVLEHAHLKKESVPFCLFQDIQPLDALR